MGLVYQFNCEKCGYEFNFYIGFGGFSYYQMYDEAFDAAIKGEYGAEIQKFLQEHNDAKINVENIFIKCRECGHFEIVPDLTTYLPDDKNSDSKKYKLVSKYHHKCRNCGGEVDIFTEDTFNADEHSGKLKCSVCHGKLIGSPMRGGVWE